MKLNPNSIAIEGGGLSISCDELMSWTYGYANEIIEKNIIDSWIGIDLSLGWKVYPAILASWITGNGYLPINFDFPKTRILDIQKQVQWPLIINSATVCINKKKVQVIHGEKAYLLFTSGTTGEPKGVPITQINLEAFAGHYLNHDSIKFTSKDKFLQSYELTFDVSVFCFLMAFVSGATLVLPNSKKTKQLSLFKAMLDYEVTVASFVPSVIRLTKDFLPRVQFPQIRYSFFSGEALMGDWAKVWMESVPNAKVYNCYGPTETVIVCTEELLNDLDDSYFENSMPLPLGDKFKGIDFQIKEGEIVYTGKQTFNGYLNQEPITEYFSGDLAHIDENGKLIFDGRKDNQIQWNGYRIELEEIDRVLSQKIEGWVKTIFSKELYKLVIFSNEARPRIDVLLKGNFPGYYKPSSIIQLNELPLNLHGKIDIRKMIKIAKEE